MFYATLPLNQSVICFFSLSMETVERVQFLSYQCANESEIDGDRQTQYRLRQKATHSMTSAECRDDRVAKKSKKCDSKSLILHLYLQFGQLFGCFCSVSNEFAFQVYLPLSNQPYTRLKTTYLQFSHFGVWGLQFLWVPNTFFVMSWIISCHLSVIR